MQRAKRKCVQPRCTDPSWVAVKRDALDQPLYDFIYTYCQQIEDWQSYENGLDDWGVVFTDNIDAKIKNTIRKETCKLFPELRSIKMLRMSINKSEHFKGGKTFALIPHCDPINTIAVVYVLHPADMKNGTIVISESDHISTNQQGYINRRDRLEEIRSTPNMVIIYTSYFIASL